MKVLINNKNTILALITIAMFFSITLIERSYGDDADEEYKKQMAVEMELLKRLESRFNAISGSFADEKKRDKINFPFTDYGDGGKDKAVEVYSKIKGMKIIRKLYEFGVYLYSVEAGQVPLIDVLEQLALSGRVDISIERIEPAILRKRIDVSLKNLPFQDVLEMVTGIYGLEFMLNEDMSLKITIPSNMGFKRPQDYFQDKIVKTFRKLQIKYPKSGFVPESHFKLGELFYSTGLKIVANQEYMVVAERYPKHPMAKKSLINAAQCFMDMGDFKKARDMYNEFIERYPRDESLENVYWAITNTWYEDGKYSVAVALYKKILEMYPSTRLAPKIRERMGFAYMKMGEFSKAFDILIALKKEADPSELDVDRDFMIGECLCQMERTSDAFVVFASIIGKKELKDDKLEKTMLRQAECLHKMDYCIEAIQAYKKWIQVSGEEVYGMLNVGKCLRHLGLYSQAIGVLKDVMARNTGDKYRDQIKFELAMSYYNSDQYDKAIKLFADISINKDSEQFVDSNFYGAESLFAVKEYKDAIPYYKKLAVLLDEDAERLEHVEKRLAACYQNTGLYSKALDVVTKQGTADN